MAAAGIEVTGLTLVGGAAKSPIGPQIVTDIPPEPSAFRGFLLVMRAERHRVAQLAGEAPQLLKGLRVLFLFLV